MEDVDRESETRGCARRAKNLFPEGEKRGKREGRVSTRYLFSLFFGPVTHSLFVFFKVETPPANARELVPIVPVE